MLDVELIRKEPEKVKEGIAKKNVDPALVDQFLSLDKTWRETVKEIDEKRANQKKMSAKKPSPEDIQQAKKNKEDIKVLEEWLLALEKERNLAWLKIPNVPLEDVPVGKDESGNKIIRKWGEPAKFDFEAKDHIALGESLGIIDTE